MTRPMNAHQLTDRLIRAGVDPSAIEVRVNGGAFRRLVAGRHPGLRQPTAAQVAVLRERFGSAVRLASSPAVGAAQDPSFAHVFKGWNVWSVDQVDELPFSVLMVGVSKSRQLQIWVEDAVRLGAPNAEIADPLALKGSMVEILPDVPAGLPVLETKERVPGAPMLTSGPSSMFTVRFFNRGAEADIPWPHDESYILDRVYEPSPSSPATSGPAPGTIVSTNVTQPAKQAAEEIAKVALVLGAVYLGVTLLAGSRRRAA